jgi:hypothetical protein
LKVFLEFFCTSIFGILFNELKKYSTDFKTVFSRKNLSDVGTDDIFFLIESVAIVFVKCVDISI